MFCRKIRSNSDTKVRETLNKDDFGWWLTDEDDLTTPISSQNKDGHSIASSESMLSCIDSEGDESYSLAQEFRQDFNDNEEGIELTSLIHQSLDSNLIQQDAIQRAAESTPFPAKEAKQYFDESQSKSQRFEGVYHTPERLVKPQEYGILTTLPNYLSITGEGIVSENENSWNTNRCRRRLNYLIDSKQVGTAHLNALLDHHLAMNMIPEIASQHWKTSKQVYDDDSPKRNDNDDKTKDELKEIDDMKSTDLQSSDIISKKSSYERLHVTWEDCKHIETSSSSLEDTSGIHSNDWSSDTHSDLQNTPLCLCDELASTNYKQDVSQGRCCAINEVVSILEDLDTDPEKAAVLLEEDRFCDSTSSHDQLTRLALAIETDGNVPGVFENTENSFYLLQKRVEKLQASSKDIFRDISNLRKSFQSDEERITSISSNANKLREDIQGVRCLDDLLNLLRGELERISNRNWPFVVGHTEHHSEELNLIV